MARPKKQLKAKEPVTIRFKDLAKGSSSIYLDIYRDGVRSYEFLKLYLIPEKTEADKLANLATLDAANAIKAQRVREIVNGEAGLKDTPGEGVLLLDWMQIQRDKAEAAARDAGRPSKSTAKSYDTTRLHLARYIEEKYKGQPLTLAQVDKDFCAGFVRFMRDSKKARTTKSGRVEHKNGGTIGASTCNCYFAIFSAALNAAYKKGLIPSNPANRLEANERASRKQTERDYLTEEELKALSTARCPNDQVRAAFLFSCMCGLRWGDIEALTWDKLHREGEGWKVETRMLKTQKLLYLPLGPEAVKFLPERGKRKGTEKVFTLPTICGTNKNVKKWAERAGIEKHITFHCARHTFATLMLTLGADLYTTSKLLGHSDIQVTQIYAAIVDKKKQEAVDLLSGILD